MSRRKGVTIMYQTPRLKYDKRGSTLIEVIVSVLIVGIVFVPLMIGLNGALRVNKNTENELYAESVATNVIEVCKTFGTNGLSKLKLEQDADSTKGIATIFTGATLEKNSNTEFTITEIRCGTDNRLYSANVKFEPIHDNQNDFSGYPTVEGIQNAIIVSFAEDNLTWVMDQVIPKINELGYSGSANMLPLDELKKTTNIPKWLSREIYIGLEPGTDDSGNAVILVTKKIVYTAKNNEIDGKYPFGSTDTSLTFSFPAQEKPSSDPVGMYKDFPEMIVVTYKQLKDKKGNNLILKNGAGDTIRIKKEVAGETKVYALSENGKTLQGKGVYVTFNAEGSADDLTHAYTNLVQDIGAYTNCIKETTFGTANSDLVKKMKNVTITIKDSYGEVVSTKKSTVIEAD